MLKQERIGIILAIFREVCNDKNFLNDPTLLLNAVGEGIYGFDLSGNAVFVNPAAERMTG